MLSKIKFLAAAAVVAGSASGAFAATLPQQDQTEWFIDSGRYLGGHPSEPSYPGPAQNQTLIEDRNSAVLGDFSAPAISTGRDAMVQELGN